MNKRLVRSAFESDEWIERIAANPKGERATKMHNESGNKKQHSKLGFATKAKKNNPALDFDQDAQRPAASNDLASI